MSLFERITEAERTAIVNYINDFAGAGGNSPEDATPTDLDYILRFWNKNKEDIAKMFGDKLILKQHIEYSRPEDLMEKELDEILYCKHNGFLRQFNYAIEEECGPHTWDYESPNEEKRRSLHSLLSAYAMVRGTYEGVPISFTDDETGKEIVIPTGCKIMKAISKFVKAKSLSRANFEKLRLDHSMVLNQKKMTGTLCLSIHPLDFMTMSDNNCDWRSCMNWMDGGEYRQGTVEMMNSKFIVMAYLESKDHAFDAGGIKWSNKKWRQLFIVSPKIIMGIKAYPYYSKECENIALCWLRQMAEANGIGHYMDDIQSINNYDISTLTDGREVRFNFEMNHMYNDIEDGHKAFVTYDELINPRDSNLDEYGCYRNLYEYFNLSGESECMCCGDDMTPYLDEVETSALLCPSCEEVYYCCDCGERIYGANNRYLLDGDYYCEWCYDRAATYCPCCEEFHHNENFNTLYITFDDEEIADNSPFVEICDDCIDSKKFGSVNWLTADKGNYWCSSHAAVNPKNFKDKNLWGFFCDEEDKQRLLEINEVASA